MASNTAYCATAHTRDKDVVDCCVSASDEYVADVVIIVVIHDDVGESECANVDDDVLAEQLC